MTAVLAGLLFSTSCVLASDEAILRGFVRDAQTGDPLPAAHVRLLTTTRGTITGTGGEYTLKTADGMYAVVTSMIGYRPDTTHLMITGMVTHTVPLRPSEIVLPEVVISSEDPAVEIIRRAIRNKRRWIDRLVSYQFEAFTRQVLQRDTAIASITESFTRGYWQQGDTLREVVLQKRQTDNIKQSFNFASVGRLLNFNDDEIRFFGYTFVGPTALDALDYYDYTLVTTGRDAGHSVHDIRMKPRSRTVPLFDGTVHITDETYALVGIDVVPNEAFAIPFLKERKLRYRQQFALFDNDFWLPVDIRISAGATLSMLGFSFPRFGFDQTSVITEYSINTPIPDSISAKPRLTVDSSATRYDSTFWTGPQILPLTPREKLAYGSLDSTQTLEVQFRPGGAAMTLGGDLGGGGTVLKYLDLSFNRVEGVHLGASTLAAPVLPFLSVSVGLGYGFSNKRSAFLLGGTVYTSPEHTLGFGVEAYRRLDNSPDAEEYGPLLNSMTSLLYKNDYHDYFGAEGWKVFATLSPSRSVQMTGTVLTELHTATESTTDYSLLSRSRSYRPNPPVREGMMRSMQVAARFGNPPVPFGVVVQNILTLNIEHASSSLLKGAFDFTRYEAGATLVVPTFAPSHLFRPQFVFRMGAGASSGTLPFQRAFSLESPLSGFAPAGVFKGMEVKEYGGTGYLSFQAEHNFRSLPFLALGIPFLYENSIELVVHGGAARTWNEGGGMVQETGGWYTEAGFGINRLLDVFRVDCTWRLSSPRTFRVTIGVAQIL